MAPFIPPSEPISKTVVLGEDRPLTLDGGKALARFPVAYETYGKLDADRRNAVLVCHALTGDQIVAGPHPVTGRPGWWERVVGPGKVLDTERYFIICINVLGGCMGTTGPGTVNPVTGERWGPDFPIVTIADMVRAQAMLLDRLGIADLLLVIGGSMGGMQALQWLKDYPERVFAAAPLATAARHSAQQIALHSIGRRAIMSDPNWQNGRYYGTGRAPLGGLEVARMLAHLSYRSPEEMDARFDRARTEGEGPLFALAPEFQVESYLAYHGRRFTERFDPNSYLTITKAMDYFELAPQGNLAGALAPASAARVFLAAFTTDWLYPPAQNAELAEALTQAGAQVRYEVFDAIAGHDSFLLEVPALDTALKSFLADCAAARGLAP